MSLPQQTLFERIVARLHHAAAAVRAIGRRRVEIRGTPRLRRFLLLFVFLNIWPLAFFLSKDPQGVFSLPFFVWGYVAGVPLQALGFPQFRITDWGPHLEGPWAYGAILFFWTTVAYAGSWRPTNRFSA